MNKQSKITGTSAPMSDPRKPERACVPQSLTCSEIGATGLKRLASSTGGASAPNAPTLPDDGYGNQPRCITCRKGMSNCLCDAPDIDVPSGGEMKRIYPSLFERSSFGMLSEGWNRVEL